MRFISSLFALAALALVLGTGPAPVRAHDSGALHFHGEQLSQDQNHVCFRNCIEQNGTSAKASCAMQCGVAGNSGQGMGGGQRDCGTIYKNCRQACGADTACKDECRAARKQCY